MPYLVENWIRFIHRVDLAAPSNVERVKTLIPLQRGGKPEEVAASIAFLLSDEASFITGSFVDIAGGK